MNKRFFSFVLSIIMLFTVLSAAMPVSAAAKSTTTKNTTSSEPKQQYVVPFDNNYAAVRETPSTTEKHPIQIMAFSRGEYCIYVKSIPVEKEKDKEVETWYVVKTVWGQTGYVASWAGKIVNEKPTKPTTTTTVSTKKTTTTTKVASTTASKPTTTTTVKKPTTTKKPATTTTKKVTTTTTTQKSSELYYLTSSGEYTNIRSGKSTKTSNLGRVYSKDIAVADKKEGNWYHLIILNGKKKVGWCQANLMKEIPSPTTTITTTASTTASKPTTTTAKKTMTTTSVKNTTTTTKPSTTTTKKTTTTTKANFLYFDLGKGGKTRLDDVKIVNRTKIQVGFSYDPNSNTLYIDSVG